VRNVKDGAELLKDKMARRKLTQESVAERVDVKAPTVSRWLSRKRSPSRSQSVALKREFGIPVEAWVSVVGQ
jgi:transcriptional regulator with XRE-family HTH domain